MKLYLVQHGNANPEDVDPEKNLSEKGKSDVEKVARFLKDSGVNVPEIYHSGKARAQQTAEILKTAVNPDNVTKRDVINPMDPINDLKAESEKRDKDLMVVGHLPYLNKLASDLLTGDESSETIQFQQGGVLALENRVGKWQVVWMVVPDLLA